MSGNKISPIGIKALDDALGGGLYKGSLTLLEGPTGSGKTLLSSLFLYFGASFLGEKGVYASLSLSKKFFYSYLRSLNMDFEALEKKNLFKFLEFPTVVSKDALKELIESMIMEFIDFGTMRFVIDPINPLLAILNRIELRATMHNIFKKYLERYNVTSILVADTAKSRLDPAYREIEFLSDIILLIRSKIVNNHRIFKVKVMKYRGRKIETHIINLTIKDFTQIKY